jgi:hypothetical protein
LRRILEDLRLDLGAQIFDLLRHVASRPVADLEISSIASAVLINS